jgi:hypothetical protein
MYIAEIAHRECLEILHPTNCQRRIHEWQEEQPRADKTKDAEQPAMEPITLASGTAETKEIAFIMI